MKTEASGYPSCVRTSEDDAFYASEGTRLDKFLIRPNGAKHGQAKLCLNPMWGKLTERNNRIQTKIIKDRKALYRCLVTPGFEVASMTFASDEVVWASWRFTEEERIPNLRHTNEVIGAYVKAGVHLHLYYYLDKLQERAIYCHTESVIFVQPSDESLLVESGDNLGDMTSELKPSEFIEEFVSGA